MESDPITMAWSRYWSSGALASNFSAGGQPFLDASGFATFFAQFEDEAFLLDLGCGAGIVSAWAARTAELQGKRFTILGVDAADFIQAPPTTMIQIASGARIERLPVQNHRFDGAASQFGFEFAEESAACEELLRVLKPGAPFRFVIHAKEGTFYADALRRLTRLKSLFEPDGAAPACREFSARWRLGAEDPAAAAAAAQLAEEAVARALEATNGAPPGDGARMTAQVLASFLAQRDEYPPDILADSISDICSETMGHATRLATQAGAARDYSQAETMLARLSGLGFGALTIEACMDDQSAHVGWIVQGVRG